MTDLATLIRKCESLVHKDIDQAERLWAVIEKQMAADEEDASDDDSDSEFDSPSDTSSQDDDLEEDDLDKLRKAVTPNLNWDTNTDVITDRGRGHQNMGATIEPRGTARSRGYDSQSDTYQTSVSPAVRAADPTAWDARITQVMQRDSVSKTEAMVRARLEWPGEFQAWNQVNAAAPNTEQQTRRNYPSTNVGKSAPTCWEEHVADHMARYQVSERLAKVRLANAEGYVPMRARMFAKNGQTVQAAFDDEVEKIYESDPTITLEAATRQARLENPRLAKALSLLT
jgi:hypothetical protein